MKLILIFLSIIFPCIIFANLSSNVSQVSTLSQNSTPLNNLKAGCEVAVELSCQTSNIFNGNFSNGILTDSTITPVCIEEVPEFELKEFWIELNLNGYLNYFIDGNGVNGGLEIYSGNCDNLQLVACEPAMGNSTFYGFYAPQFNQYFVRVFGYDYSGGSNFNVQIQCFSPVPTCNLSIDNIEVGSCKNINGLVDVELSGTLNVINGNQPISMEILTDAGLYFFDGYMDGLSWTSNAQVGGTMISYISVGVGNSENFCSDVISLITIPEVYCDGHGLSALLGNLVWNATCSNRTAEMRFYTPGTNLLIGTYSTEISNNGNFRIDNPAIGIFDLILKVDGCLAKGFSDIDLAADSLNVLDCGTLIRGDVNGDNAINVVDLSIINIYFGQALTANDPIFLDLNCDGMINVVDLSVIGAAFGMVGVLAPF